MTEEDWKVAVELKEILRKLNTEDRARVYEIILEDIISAIISSKPSHNNDFIQECSKVLRELQKRNILSNGECSRIIQDVKHSKTKS